MRTCFHAVTALNVIFTLIDADYFQKKSFLLTAISIHIPILVHQ